VEFLAEEAEHRVDEHSGHRHVEPHRQGVASDRAVLAKAPGEREKEAQENERQHQRRKGHVRDEDEEVHGANEAVSAETRVAVRGVVNDVRHEKEGGGAQRHEDAPHVGRDVSAANGAVGEDEKKRTRRVEKAFRLGSQVTHSGTCAARPCP
jgi:hypothetical protein